MVLLTAARGDSRVRQTPCLGDAVSDEGTYPEPDGVGYSYSSGILDLEYSKFVSQTCTLALARMHQPLLRKNVAQLLRLRYSSLPTSDLELQFRVIYPVVRVAV